jgi:hypothetical protein
LANITDNGKSESATLRWAPFFNMQVLLNKDFGNRIGLFTGIAERNVGYIYNGYIDPETGTGYKKKFRSYNLGVPFALKLGKMDGTFIYGGYELELPFLYKEKTFLDDHKINKITGWFSNREEPFQHGFFFGIEFAWGLNVRFKYYLSEFHNQDYTVNGIKPYEGLKSNIFYISLSTHLSKNLKERQKLREAKTELKAER